MKLVLLLSLIFLCGTTCFGQNDRITLYETVRLKLTDGSQHTGKVISITDDTILLQTEKLGNITIPVDEIQRFNTMDQSMNIDDNGYPIDDHNSTHYLVSPSGYTLKKGQSYYENIGIFFNSYSVGITDRFSLTAGTEILSLILGRIPVIYIAPRYSIPITEDKLNLSIGTTFFTSVQDGFEGVGILQGALTFGDRNNNFTIGSGFGYSTNGLTTEGIIPIFGSCMFRLSERISLVSDNLFFTETDFNTGTGLISLAARIHFKKSGSALNAGLFRPLEDTGNLLAIPFVSATIAIR